MINLSRNSPVAFVVGGAGFIGSRLCEVFLAKNIQVVVVDDFSTGRRENLVEVAKNKNFHILNNAFSDQSFPRLDYAIFTITEDQSRAEYRKALRLFLDIVSTYSPKALIVSSIELYGEKSDEANLNEAERELAKLSEEKHLNARILRLAPIYGGRMHFREEEPIFKLIRAASANKLKTTSFPLDFISRSLYIEDAIDLLIKALMHGSTSQKIYDGALLNPLKLSELKQLLEDPLWYESRGFEPTQLPPWPTPNLVKTQKELSWKPRASMTEALKETLKYVQSRPELIEKEERRVEEKVEEEAPKPAVPIQVPEPKKRREVRLELGKYRKLALPALAVILVVWAFLLPVALLTMHTIFAVQHLNQAAEFLKVGDYEKASNEASLAKESSSQTLEILEFPGLFPGLENISRNLSLTADAESGVIAATANLRETLAVIAGSSTADYQTSLDKANDSLSDSDKRIQVLRYQLDNSYFGLANSFLDDWKKALGSLESTTKGEKVVAFLLSQLAIGDKKYLVTIADNRQLRPAGGVLDSYALVELKNNKFLSVKVGGVGELDQKLTESVNPPADLASDLGIGKWGMKDSAYDPDFPAAARWSQWFFSKETGETPAGVISLDLTALSAISNSVDQKNLTVDDLVHAPEQVLKDTVNRIFFLSNGGWIASIELLNKLVAEKHLMFYSTDPKVFSYLSSEGWVGSFPSAKKEPVGERDQFLAAFESNIGQDKVNLQVKRGIKLTDTVGEDGGVSHNLSLQYTNQNPPSGDGGSYKFRLKLYLRAGAKLNKASWGDQVVTGSLKSFSDYGRAGYSTVLELKPGEQKTLDVDYQDSQPLEFQGNKLAYHLDFVKQPGTDGDELTFRVVVPQAWKVDGQKSAGQGKLYTKNLLTDSSFIINLDRGE